MGVEKELDELKEQRKRDIVDVKSTYAMQKVVNDLTNINAKRIDELEEKYFEKKNQLEGIWLKHSTNCNDMWRDIKEQIAKLKEQQDIDRERVNINWTNNLNKIDELKEEQKAIKTQIIRAWGVIEHNKEECFENRIVKEVLRELIRLCGQWQDEKEAYEYDQLLEKLEGTKEIKYTDCVGICGFCEVKDTCDNPKRVKQRKDSGDEKSVGGNTAPSISLNSSLGKPQFKTDSKAPEPKHIGIWYEEPRENDDEKVWFDVISREIHIDKDYLLVKREDLQWLCEQTDHYYDEIDEMRLENIKGEYGIE